MTWIKICKHHTISFGHKRARGHSHRINIYSEALRSSFDSSYYFFPIFVYLVTSSNGSVTLAHTSIFTHSHTHTSAHIHSDVCCYFFSGYYCTCACSCRVVYVDCSVTPWIPLNRTFSVHYQYSLWSSLWVFVCVCVNRAQNKTLMNEKKNDFMLMQITIARLCVSDWACARPNMGCDTLSQQTVLPSANCCTDRGYVEPRNNWFECEAMKKNQKKRQCVHVYVCVCCRWQRGAVAQ